MAVPPNPKRFEECEALLSSADYQIVLRSRLVQLAFSDNLNVAVKAVDLLLQMPPGGTNSELAGYSDDELRLANERISTFLAGPRPGASGLDGGGD
jgi:hypothetical protein